MTEIEIAFALLVAFSAGRVWERNAERERAEAQSQADLITRLSANTESRK